MRTQRTYFVYIIGSRTGTLYIGMTGKLQKRIFQHKFEHIEGFTNQYEVHRLLYWESYENVHNAIDREKQLKGWRRSKKIELIEKQNPQRLDLSRDWYPHMKENADSSGASTPGERSSTTLPPLSMTGNKSWGEK